LPSTGGLNESLIPDDPAERKLYAMRLIAQRCIYGVDKNPLAVEMAKLSLWLLTMAKDKPFEFLDHNIRCGDSLVGIHCLEQLQCFNLAGVGNSHQLFLQFLDDRIAEALRLRLRIGSMQANTIDEIEEQAALFASARNKIERLRYAADLLVSAEFGGGSVAVRKRARNDAAIGLAISFPEEDISLLRNEAKRALATNSTFHWPLEFPEVFVNHGGFDCVLTNPPFVEGGVISDALRNLFAELYSSSKVQSSSSPASSAKLSLVGLFSEQITRLIKPGSSSAFLCPKPFLRNERYWRPREVLLDATSPLAIFDMPHNAFASASVETCGIVVCKKPSMRELSKFLVVPPGESPYGRTIREISLAEIISDERCTIRIEASSDEMSFVNLLTQQCGTFAEFFESRDGINPGRKDFKALLLGERHLDQFVPDGHVEGRPSSHRLENSEPFDPNRHMKTINGRDFTEFSKIVWKGKYLRYASEIASVPEFWVKGTRWSAQLREAVFFDRTEKVVSRQTANTLIATIDSDQFFPLNNVHVHFPTETNTTYCCLCLLGFLNSKLLRFVYRIRTEETGKVFPQVHISAIRQLPIPTSPLLKHVSSVRNAVTDILCNGLTSERRDVLDTAIFDLFGLNVSQRDLINNAIVPESE
jgi:hypothetical protein